MSVERLYKGIDRLHEFQTSCEEKANQAGGFPLIGIVSGAGRAIGGLVHAVAAAIFAAIAGIGHACTKVFRCSDKNQQLWKTLKWEATEQLVHGLLNVVHGSAELLEHTIFAMGWYGLDAPMTMKWGVEHEYQPMFAYGSFQDKYR